ncbi:hypothetical protein [Marinomonas fungiae]|uniref:DUF4376 domain-containing protein n=1 Tax=Marinomonas fungiae TaxID=1137284 RepID=A0A0K6IJA0_9GAMM|nr:hypothetical protein [Marinomonas fungiae]CUB03168.1 hypothetical protein Ga0061065_10316 [Marinomonas fungiae]
MTTLVQIHYTEQPASEGIRREYEHPLGNYIALHQGVGFVVAEYERQPSNAAKIVDNLDVLLPLSERKKRLLQRVSERYAELISEANCDTGLGFRVNSGYTNLTDFRECALLYDDFSSDPDTFRQSKRKELVDQAESYFVITNSDIFIKLRDFNNNFLQLTRSELSHVIDSIVAWGFAMKAHKWMLEAAITSADIVTIDNIQVSHGWPQ